MENQNIKVLGTALNLRVNGEKSSYLNTPVSKDYCAVDILKQNLNNKEKISPYNFGVLTIVDAQSQTSYREKVGIRPVIYHIDGDNYYLSFLTLDDNPVGYKIEHNDNRIKNESDDDYSFLNGIVINLKNLKTDNPITFKFIIKGVPNYDRNGNFVKVVDLEAKLAFNLCDCKQSDNNPDTLIFANNTSDALLESAAGFNQKSAQHEF